jgi:hypothetical protein
MIRSMRRTLAVALLFAFPLQALAQQHGGSSAPSRPAPAPAYHPAPAQAPVYRQAPPPAYHPSTPAEHPGGFNMQRDINGHPVPVHPIAPRAPVSQPLPAHGTTLHGTFASGPYRGWYGPVVRNPYHWNNWGWNHGVVWYPAPIYWGWGFWGPWAYGVAGLVLYGSIVNYPQQLIYPSYQIQPSSPGAQLLENYGLTQTECGPPNLVVIWGPNNSVICAYPNNLVSAGNYGLDPSTLTITAEGTPPSQ